MPQNPARTARTRAEILDHAARLFRLRGYAGTNIDDIMLAAGLTRGAFYAHFRSKDDLFAEAVRAGHGLLRQAARRGSRPRVLKAYLDKDELAANAPACTLAALAGDVARAPCRPGWPTPTCSTPRSASWRARQQAQARRRRHGGGDPGGRRRGLARASGDTRLSDWLLRCAAAGRAARCSSRELRQGRNDRGHAGKPLALVVPDALHDHAVVGPQLAPKARSSGSSR